MFIGAILIGLLTAYYFGVRPGITAAGVSVVLFVAADIVPGASLFVYAAVGIFVAGVCLLGPRMAKNQEQEGGRRVRKLARQALGKLWRLL